MLDARLEIPASEAEPAIRVCAYAPPRPAAVPYESRDSLLGHIMDVTLAILMIVILSPVLLIVALLVKRDGGLAIFTHKRVGRNGRHFHCLKFRSMCLNADKALERHLAASAAAREEWGRDHKLKDDPRVTSFGRFLRASSLDELPQLFNVVRGEMSLVGPRPITDAEVPRYGRRIAAYWSVRPGITGLWQVSGRNDVSYRRRVAIDTLYVKRKSFLLDLGIMFMTLPAVLLSRGSC